MGALASRTALPARPPRIAWNTRPGSAPALVASTIASDTAAIPMFTMIWFASLVTDPLPTGPTSVAEAPITSKQGFARSKSAESPPTINASVPLTAPGSPPLTGLSRNRHPSAPSFSAHILESPGVTLLISTTRLPGARDPATPSGANRTRWTMLPLGRMVNTRPHSCPICEHAAERAPSLVRISTRSWLTSFTRS